MSRRKPQPKRQRDGAGDAGVSGRAADPGAMRRLLALQAELDQIAAKAGDCATDLITIERLRRQGVEIDLLSLEIAQTGEQIGRLLERTRARLHGLRYEQRRLNGEIEEHDDA